MAMRTGRAVRKTPDFAMPCSKETGGVFGILTTASDSPDHGAPDRARSKSGNDSGEIDYFA